MYQSMDDIKSPTGTPTTLPLLPPTSAETIQSHVAALRAAYRTGAVSSLAARKTQLVQLRRLIEEGFELLQAAMKKDLHKHATETWAMEIAGTLSEIQEHLDYMDDWAAPQKVGTNLVNIPGSSYTMADPLGVCCIMGTWNYPLMLVLMPLVGCLSAGNCALIRLPSEGTCDNVAAALAYLLDKYMDPSVVRYVAGGIDANKAMLAQKFDLIFCTGGCTIGKIVARAAAEHLTPVVLELGGKSPAIIDASIDVAVTARRLVWGAFTNAGQTCVRPDYIMVHASVGPQLVAAMKQAVIDMFGADPQASDSYGRLVNAAQFERISRIYASDKAFAVHGGQSDGAERFFGPTIFNFESNYAAFAASAAMEGEIFGPLLPVCYYTDINAVLGHVSDGPKPLALYVFSTSGDFKRLVLTRTTSGSACVNDTMMQLSNPHLPFGGVGNSGMGSYHGRQSFRVFSHQKSVLYKHFALDIPQRYQPYTPFARKLLGAALFPIPRLWPRLALLAVVAAVVAVVLPLAVAATK
ncbi:aldehyde dehydrogenase [Achlya hypogyna]|uniref:Aldehyde dehydrogenase n=1 Tax=Achlya hypogyna TaxID=1202772 RepID=A0A1V9YJD2_ACHHY|nr:aldehyde dehydrogenase [Achlya hypogyna]